MNVLSFETSNGRTTQLIADGRTSGLDGQGQPGMPAAARVKTGGLVQIGTGRVRKAGAVVSG